MVSIDELMSRLIAECGGDVHAALKALLLINERLESELQYFYEQSTSLIPYLSPVGGMVH